MLTRHCRISRLALALIAAASLLAGGCLTTIDSSCTSLAETHCASCFACGDQVDGITGPELCNVSAGQDASRADCQDTLSAICRRQARSMEDPFPDLEDCQPAIDAQTCDELVEHQALGQPAPPPKCRRFL